MTVGTAASLRACLPTRFTRILALNRRKATWCEVHVGRQARCGAVVSTVVGARQPPLQESRATLPLDDERQRGAVWVSGGRRGGGAAVATRGSARQPPLRYDSPHAPLAPRPGSARRARSRGRGMDAPPPGWPDAGGPRGAGSGAPRRADRPRAGRGGRQRPAARRRGPASRLDARPPSRAARRVAGLRRLRTAPRPGRGRAKRRPRLAALDPRAARRLDLNRRRRFHRQRSFIHSRGDLWRSARSSPSP